MREAEIEDSWRTRMFPKSKTTCWDYLAWSIDVPAVKPPTEAEWDRLDRFLKSCGTPGADLSSFSPVK